MSEKLKKPSYASVSAGKGAAAGKGRLGVQMGAKRAMEEKRTRDGATGSPKENKESSPKGAAVGRNKGDEPQEEEEEEEEEQEQPKPSSDEDEDVAIESKMDPTLIG